MVTGCRSKKEWCSIAWCCKRSILIESSFKAPTRIHLNGFTSSRDQTPNLELLPRYKLCLPRTHSRLRQQSQVSNVISVYLHLFDSVVALSPGIREADCSAIQLLIWMVTTGLVKPISVQSDWPNRTPARRRLVWALFGYVFCAMFVLF